MCSAPTHPLPEPEKELRQQEVDISPLPIERLEDQLVIVCPAHASGYLFAIICNS